jgi:glycine cleavage system H protein
MHYPDNLLYNQDHAWVDIEGNLATIGISDFAQEELGDIISVEIECLGEEFEQHDAFGSIESAKVTSDLFMPISGRIVAVNETLMEKPEHINNAPYKKGWMIKVDIAPDADLSGFMSASDYKKMIGA